MDVPGHTAEWYGRVLCGAYKEVWLRVQKSSHGKQATRLLLRLGSELGYPLFQDGIAVLRRPGEVNIP